jgi:uncharacterized membrane protein YjdF
MTKRRIALNALWVLIGVSPALTLVSAIIRGQWISLCAGVFFAVAIFASFEIVEWREKRNEKRFLSDMKKRNQRGTA